tara:strand:+ start:1075 stop:1335 length:261 start_codon:yes stop_codon:yes gene_type:complete
MDLNQLVLLVKKKIEKNILTENVIIKDKTYLHKKHLSHELGKFHLEIIIKSKELNNFNRIQATRKIYKLLDEEIKKYIHSIKILIS